MFMRDMFVHKTVAGVYRTWYGCCSLFGFFDVDFIFEGTATMNSPSTCNVDLGLVEFVFNPHFVEFNSGF